LHPKFLQNPEKGTLRCHYNMMPFSGTGNRVRPGQNRRAKEISMVTEKALAPVLNLGDFPNAVVDVFIDIPEADAGTRAAGICAASIALADAGLAMRDLVAAVSVGKVGETVLVDLDYNEEAYDDEVSDIPVAMIPSTEEVTLLQMDGAIGKEKLAEALRKVKQAALKINEVQRAALKDKYAAVREQIIAEGGFIGTSVKKAPVVEEATEVEEADAEMTEESTEETSEDENASEEVSEDKKDVKKAKKTSKPKEETQGGDE
jgi:exosome complex component RRP41